MFGIGTAEIIILALIVVIVAIAVGLAGRMKK
jgi:hypothetical protein